MKRSETGAGGAQRQWRASLLREALTRREPRVLAALVLLAGFVWAFAALADEVLEGETRGFDTALLLALRNPADLADPIGPGWLEEIGRDFTALGGVAVLSLAVLAVIGFCLLQARPRTALLVFFASTGGLLLSSLLKHGFERPRPDLVPHGSIVYTASFPSGHSMMSALVYLTLAALLARGQPDRRVRLYLLALALFVTLGVGVSRVYLGVHWPTDVLAGWAAGAAWALLFWLIAQRFDPL